VKNKTCIFQKRFVPLTRSNSLTVKTQSTMLRITSLLLTFLVGFYGFALFTDNPEILLVKAKILFGGVCLAAVFAIIVDIKEESR
jgi:hypothetical protein